MNRKIPKLGNKREFDAFAHRIDAVGPDAHAIAEVPFERARFGAAPGAHIFRGAGAFAATRRGGSMMTRGNGSPSSLGASQRDNGMVALAVDAASVRRLFQRADGQQTFHKNFEQLDETTELLRGYDQSLVFFSKMLFHELRGLPIHQFPFGGVGAAFGFGGFRSNLFEASMRI